MIQKKEVSKHFVFDGDKNFDDTNIDKKDNLKSLIAGSDIILSFILSNFSWLPVIHAIKVTQLSSIAVYFWIYEVRNTTETLKSFLPQS